MISELINSLKPSATLSLATKAKKLKAEGKDIISLTVGEPDWDTYEPIKEAAVKAIMAGKTKYVPTSGVPELRSAIANKTNSFLKTNYSSANITVSSGGKFLIYSFLMSVLNKGDEVIIPSPYWVSYPSQVEIVGAKPVIVETNEASNYKMTGEMLEKAITKKTKAIILNSPSNPTGGVYSLDELKDIAKVLKKYPEVLFMSDDIYNELVFTGDVAPHILQADANLKDQCVIVSGASKVYSMTGWRLGWAVGPEEIISAMTKFQSQTTSCAPSFTQYALAECLGKMQNHIAESNKVLKGRMDFVLNMISSIPDLEAKPSEGAFYLWLDIRKFLKKSYKGKDIKNSKNFSDFLLEDAEVALVPGSAFGLEGYLRASFALSESELEKAFSRIKSFLSQTA